EPANDRRLLRVLLAEVRALRSNDVEERQATGRDATEVSRSVVALEPVCEFLDLDPRLVAGRVDLVGGRDEQEVDAGVLGEAAVALLVARIRVEVGRLGELRRVDEQA